jgi:UDP-N-acetylmuramoyl-tripeptide--D-alanyl-D-alanine ligase
MKKIVQWFLKIISRLILKRYRPEIIGITGSVGKSSAKEAIAAVLAPSFSIHASVKNYNTEIGVPLTLINAKNQERSFFGWLAIFLKGIILIIFKNKNYPKIIILEMAADHPGDIKYLVDLTHPQLGVLTAVAPTHLEFFGDLEKVAAEKGYLITNLKKDSWAILNNDDERVIGFRKKTHARVLSYGLNNNSEVSATNIYIDKKDGGINLSLNYEGKTVPISLPHFLGKPIIYSVLAAATVGLAKGLSLEQIKNGLKSFQALPGRLNFLSGIKNTKIIDDTYNSSPLAVKAALEILSHLDCAGNKYAVLGDMLELGNYTHIAHQEIGEEVVRLGIDYLICVGERSIDTARSAENYGMNANHIFTFDNSKAAGSFIQDRIKEGDLLLVKGSRGVKMEKIVKEIMAEPLRAKELLVGQEEE